MRNLRIYLLQMFCGTVLAAILPAGVVSADSTSEREETIAILPMVSVSDPGNKTGEYREAVEGAVKRMERYGVLGPSEAQERGVSLGAVSVADPLGSFRLAGVALAAAEEKVFTNPAQALPLVDEVLRSLHDLVGVVSKDEGFEDVLFKAHMLRARALMDSGNRDGALDALLAVSRIFGADAEVTRASFHPSIVSAYEEVLGSPKGRSTGSLEVKATVSGAKIFLSGREMELKTDAVLSGITCGSVTIRTVSDLGRSLEHQVTIPEDGTARIEIDHAFEGAIALTSSSLGVAFEGEWSKNQIAQIGVRVGSTLRVDKVLLTGVVKVPNGQSLAGILVDTASGKVISTSVIPVEADVVSYKKATELVANLGITKLERASSAVFAGPWYSDIAGWSLVGVGVVGLAVGGVMGGEYNSKSDELANSNPAFGDTLNDARDLQSEAESAGTVSAVSIGLGAAALVTGVTLFLLHDGDAEGMASSQAEFPTISFFPTISERGTDGAKVSMSLSF